MRALLIAMLALVIAGPAVAQTKPKLTGNIVKDIESGVQAGTQKAAAGVEAALAKPFNDLANFIGAANGEAITLSTAIPELQDGHGQQCWIASKQFSDVIKAHPVPVTFKAPLDLESLRLLMMAANNLCANVHCTQVFADLSNGIQQLAPINASLPIPSLHDICAKIPQIAVVVPVSVPATTPAPAATPVAVPAAPTAPAAPGTP